MENMAVPPKNNHVCPHQYSFMLDNFIRRLFQNPRKILREYVKEGDLVLDMGCGPGFFTIDMAKMVGAEGKVIAVDLQEKMLRYVEKKARKHKVLDRIEFHRCEANCIGVKEKVDFVLAFYMVHETPDMHKFFLELKDILKVDGKVLVVEPKFHVTKEDFRDTLNIAENLGFQAVDFPKKKGGRSVLLCLKG